MLDTIPISPENSMVCAPVTTSGTATTAANQNAQIPSITHSAGNGRKQASAVSSNKSSKNSLCANKQSTALEITGISHDNSHASGRENLSKLLGSQIGRYSHEGFLVPLNKIRITSVLVERVESVLLLIITIIWVHCRFPFLSQLCIAIRTNFKQLSSTQGSTTIAITITVGFTNTWL
jgi:hypothetical protein